MALTWWKRLCQQCRAGEVRAGIFVEGQNPTQDWLRALPFHRCPFAGIPTPVSLCWAHTQGASVPGCSGVEDPAHVPPHAWIHSCRSLWSVADETSLGLWEADKSHVFGLTLWSLSFGSIQLLISQLLVHFKTHAQGLGFMELSQKRWLGQLTYGFCRTLESIHCIT